MDVTTTTRGVYFLANNKVYELAVAFLNSFRTHNKDIKLCLIPFDNDFDRIEALKDIYSFSIFENQEVLNNCDEISKKFHDNKLGTYRKLVAWGGDFDEFIYIDVDTIVLDDVSFVFENLDFCKIFTSQSNIDDIRKWVWKDSIFKKQKLSSEQIKYAANTGFFVSTKGLLPMNWILAQVDGALELKDDMELFCMEQPFLNYLIVTSGYSYSSLWVFLVTRINPNVKTEFWAGSPNGVFEGGRFYNPYFPLAVFLVHWAGVWHLDNESLENLPYRELWSHYRNLSLNNRYEVSTQN